MIASAIRGGVPGVGNSSLQLAADRYFPPQLLERLVDLVQVAVVGW